ncbi:MAG TPA: DUF4321 domain-containing protein [Firmicutes bacterium]|nr:DUF4321 domain-containing protein [Bacillota bacterium]
MRRSKSTGTSLVIILVLAICGSLLGVLVGEYLPWAAKNVMLGIEPPVNLDLLVLRLAFGLTIKANIGTLIGAVLGVLLVLAR